MVVDSARGVIHGLNDTSPSVVNNQPTSFSQGGQNYVAADPYNRPGVYYRQDIGGAPAPGEQYQVSFTEPEPVKQGNIEEGDRLVFIEQMDNRQPGQVGKTGAFIMTRDGGVKSLHPAVEAAAADAYSQMGGNVGGGATTINATPSGEVRSVTIQVKNQENLPAFGGNRFGLREPSQRQNFLTNQITPTQKNNAINAPNAYPQLNAPAINTTTTQTNINASVEKEGGAIGFFKGTAKGAYDWTIGGIVGLKDLFFGNWTKYRAEIPQSGGAPYSSMGQQTVMMETKAEGGQIKTVPAQDIIADVAKDQTINYVKSTVNEFKDPGYATGAIIGILATLGLGKLIPKVKVITTEKTTFVTSTRGAGIVRPVEIPDADAAVDMAMIESRTKIMNAAKQGPNYETIVSSAFKEPVESRILGVHKTVAVNAKGEVVSSGFGMSKTARLAETEKSSAMVSKSKLVTAEKSYYSVSRAKVADTGNYMEYVDHVTKKIPGGEVTVPLKATVRKYAFIERTPKSQGAGIIDMRQYARITETPAEVSYSPSVNRPVTDMANNIGAGINRQMAGHVESIVKATTETVRRPSINTGNVGKIAAGAKVMPVIDVALQAAERATRIGGSQQRSSIILPVLQVRQSPQQAQRKQPASIVDSAISSATSNVNRSLQMLVNTQATATMQRLQQQVTTRTATRIQPQPTPAVQTPVAAPFGFNSPYASLGGISRTVKSINKTINNYIQDIRKLL